MKNIILRKNEDRRLRIGHLWVFSNEIYSLEENIQTGDIVEVYDSRNNFIGTGLYNRNSLIAIRILDNNKIENIEVFLRNKILEAGELRKLVYPNRNSYRLVFSESDFLPGLIIDKYENTFVLQINSAGMEKFKNTIAEILYKEFNAENIFTANEKHFRQLEGLPEEDEILKGKKENAVINDEFIQYNIDFDNSHKTGFYFDQTDNRHLIREFVKDKNVIDCFCNSGGFGLNAIHAGARSVTFVDSAKSEIDKVKINYKLNGFETDAEFIENDVFDFLEKSVSEGKLFDMVILDPPAFAKNKRSINKAIAGYERLNRLGMKLLPAGSILVTSSCSYHISKEEFISVINNAAIKEKRKLQILYFNSASFDHPKIPSMPETEYLKFLICLVK